jgi:hypothetical protein
MVPSPPQKTVGFKQEGAAASIRDGLHRQGVQNRMLVSRSGQAQGVQVCQGQLPLASYLLHLKFTNLPS